MESLEDRTTPATITVTTLDDTFILPIVDGKVSLREAIQSVNLGLPVNGDVMAVGTYGTNDTILFDASLVGGTSTLLSNMDTIVKAVQITGPTTGIISIDGDGKFQPFSVNAKGEVIGISNLTLTNGKALAGGALQILDGDVTVNNVTFTNNLATAGSATDDGGAIMLQAGNLTVNNSTFTNNSAVAGGLGSGGAIAVSGGDSLTITGSTFTGNEAEDLGGAIATNKGITTIDSSTFTNNKNTNTFIGIGGAIALYTYGNTPESLTVTNSDFSQNSTTNNGGAIAIQAGTLTVGKSTFSENVATEAGSVGGAISLYGAGGDTKITDSTFSKNSAVLNGGALSFASNAVLTVGNSKFNGGNTVSGVNGDGGAIYILTSKASTLADSVVSGNEVTDATGKGGGLYVNVNTELGISNSTIDGNKADTGAGLFLAAGTKVTLTGSTISANEAVADGGGLYSFAGEVTITNSTISGNKADTGAGAFLLAGGGSKLILQNSTVAFNAATTKGGGVEVSTNAALTTVSSIIAQNTGTTGPDVDGKATSQGNNLFGNDSDLTITGGTNDLVNVDAKLAALADNGGVTFTHALMDGSPAINTGSNTVSLTDDQRGTGFPRETGGATDIGAFEAQQANTQTALMVDSPVVEFGDPVTFTANVIIAGGTAPAVGTVTFTIGTGADLGTVTLVNGVATVTVSNLPLGTTTVTAAYAPVTGDTFFQPSQSTPVTVDVQPIATGTTLTVDVPVVDFGSPVTFTATVTTTTTSSPANGSVTFTTGTGTVLGTVTLVNGVATQTVSDLPLGTTSVTAAYTPDTGYEASQSAAVDVTVQPIATGTALTVDSPLAAFGSPVTFTATVATTGTNAPANGSVTFTSGNGTVLGTANLVNGVATLAVNDLPLGTTTVTAAYTPDTGYAASQSAAVSVDVQEANTQTSLTVSAPEVAFRDPVTFTATTTIAGSSTPAVGTVTFTTGAGTVLGTVTLVNGVATLTISDLPVGTTTVSAAYAPAAGDTFTRPSQSGTASVDVTSPYVQGSSFGAGFGGGTAFLQDSNGKTLQNVSPFGDGFRGGVRVATGDFNGDGTPDLVAGSGPGIAGKVIVLDGSTGKTLFEVSPFESGFTGGVYVAAGDINNDGIPDLVITPDQGGGPRVQVYDGASFGKIADFYGIADKEFRGGARAGIADIDGDGFGDLIVSAGYGGGPRVAVWKGTSVAAGSTPETLISDIFVFEETLRNGAYVTGADLDGDGKAELIAGAGQGGGPRVVAFNGADLLAGTQTYAASFFAGNENQRNGVPVAVTDSDGDGLPNLLTGTGEPLTTASTGPSIAPIYKASDLPQTSPAAQETVDLFPGFTGGVFVG